MTKKLRCAIYTRKSSDEGLEQDFNSLHAQREACEAYIRSQLGEGWQLVSTAYDDGAYSGGTMERPALARLLADTEAGRIDVVVVYKVDRLTRSLAHFAKIVEVFDARSVSFVSVTQSFNTTTSMGRLTLNVLLSFAQFEREVTSERIRDKIAASKAKGMWMGGLPPLGYDINGRTLSINEPEASSVRWIFRRYLELGSARLLAAECLAAGIRSKRWITRAGVEKGGVALSRGAIFHILTSRIYLGEIAHKGHVHPGLHPAIITRELFDKVAEALNDKAAVRRQGAAKATSGSLTGVLYDATGRPMSPSFAYGKGGRLYRYYISMDLQVGAPVAPETNVIRRIPAEAIEELLVTVLQRLSGRRGLQTAELACYLRKVEARAEETHLVIDTQHLFDGDHPDLALAAIRQGLKAGEQAVPERAYKDCIRVVLPIRMKLRGGLRRVLGADAYQRRSPNPTIVAALKRAHRDLAALNASPLTTGDLIVEAQAPPTQHERQIGRLAFLAPEVQQALLQGRHHPGLSLRSLLKTPMPLAWADHADWIASLDRER